MKIDGISYMWKRTHSIFFKLILAVVVIVSFIIAHIKEEKQKEKEQIQLMPNAVHLFNFKARSFHKCNKLVGKQMLPEPKSFSYNWLLLKSD